MLSVVAPVTPKVLLITVAPVAFKVLLIIVAPVTFKVLLIIVAPANKLEIYPLFVEILLVEIFEAVNKLVLTVPPTLRAPVSISEPTDKFEI